jgi:hypothetical protein
MNKTNLLNQPDNTGIFDAGTQVHLSPDGERAWLKEFVTFWGVTDVGICFVSGADGNGYEVNCRIDRELRSILRREHSGDEFQPIDSLRWSDIRIGGKTYQLRGLTHLAEVVAEYAECRAVS